MGGMESSFNDNDALVDAEQVLGIAKAIIDGTTHWKQGAKELSKPLGRLIAHGDPRLERKNDDTTIPPTLEIEEKVILSCRWLVARLSKQL
jgi:hypothetical protein